MLTVSNITKSFGGTQAIKGSNFVIEKNKVTALIGPNGAGKTTLFDIVCGLLAPDTGDVIFDGKNLNRLPAYKRMNLGLSRTFQQVRLFKYLTIFDHIEMAEDNGDRHILRNIFAKRRKKTEDYQALLHEYGIEREVTALASELSYGQRKLLDIALAIKKSHSLLMLDEPVAGVNKVIQERIETLLLGLKKQGETMLLIDHDMGFVRKMADHVIVLDAGVVITEGKPEAALRDPRVLAAYLGE